MEEANIANQTKFIYQGVGKRFLAFVIDLLILGAILFVAVKLFGGTYTQGECNSSAWIGITFNDGNSVTLYGLCGLPAIVYFLFATLYYLVLEWVLSGTVGKLLTGIRIAKINGDKIDFKASLIRNILRIIDFLPLFYLVGAISIWTSKEKQRLGDKLAKTIVIKKV